MINPAPAPLFPRPSSSPDEILEHFVTAQSARGLTLYPEQEEAILELFGGSNVILNTPTGSGKSMVASAFHFKALCEGKRSVYTCPIKALVNEKFLSMCRDFGPENVGMMTGDASVNPQAPILCCTAEILANIALSRGHKAPFAAVIMDEFHYYSDHERGYAWQVPLLLLPDARFLLMSATLGNTLFFEKDLERLTSAPCVTVRSDRRPVPLQFEYSETPLQERVAELLNDKKAPVYLVYFTQRSASEGAQDWMSLALCSKDEKAAIAEALQSVKFNSPYGREMKRWLRHGIGVHHAGLLPKYRILVEQLAQKGLLKLICGTDTLGVGINVPIRTVVFTQLWKYDGQKAAILSVRDFRQVAGRAGRKGYDNIGHVVIQAPEHIIENKRAEEKAASDPKKKKKLVKARAPEGAVGWDNATFEKLMQAPAEALSSRFEVSHGMLLQMLGRDGDGCRAMRQMLADCHETAARKKQLRKRSWLLFRSLIDRKIVEFIPPLPNGRKLRVNVELQDDFSLHQALSLYLLDTIPLLQGEAPQPSALPTSTPQPSSIQPSTVPPVAVQPSAFSFPPADFALNVLTLCEAIVEDPEAILRRQVDRLKDEKVAEMKAADIPYEERMEKLEQVEHPKPLREFLYESFNAFAAAHPWVEKENVRPKSIAREMYERYLSFADYIKEYGLHRMEGLLLRHLSQTWKVLAQTVPEKFKTPEVIEMEDYLRELIRGIDSSLLEEWERMRNPDFVAADSADKPARPSSYDLTRDKVGFQRLLRTAIHGFMQDAAARDWESCAERLRSGLAGSSSDNEAILSEDARRIEIAFRPYFEAHSRFRLDPAGRAAANTHIEEDQETQSWRIAQVLIDPEEGNDWELRFSLSLTTSRAENRPVIAFEGLQLIGQS